MGELLLAAWIAKGFGGITARDLFAHGKPIKTSQRGQLSGNRGAGVLGLLQRRLKSSQLLWRQRIGAGNVAAGRFEPVDQTEQVFAIGFDRQHRSVSFVCQVPEELSDRGSHESDLMKVVDRKTVEFFTCQNVIFGKEYNLRDNVL